MMDGSWVGCQGFLVVINYLELGHLPSPTAEVWFGVFQTPNLQGRHVNLEGW